MKLCKILALSGALSAVFLVVNTASAQAVPEPILTDGSPERVNINDTFQNAQWYLDAINAYEAWAIAPTSSPREVVVAVIDGGYDDTHPDLVGTLWQDPDEPIDGKDNDNDGYIDDAHGWNFINDSADTRPISKNSSNDGAWEHGTITSSLIAARGNDNIGMAGMAWNAKIMPLVILGSDGSGGTDKLASAIRYAVRHRADIINLSLEGDMLDQDVADAILEATAQGLLVVIAAGNGFDGVAHNFDNFEIFPACHPGAAGQSVLVVTGTNPDGSRYPSANFGSCTDLAAPGSEIFASRPSYEPNGNHKNVSGYGTWSGTSLSAPLVSGVAAMLKAKYPHWTGEQLARRILDTTAPFDPSIDSNGMGAGLLDAYAALQDAPAQKYGSWNLYASTKGNSPTVLITDTDGNKLYAFPVGNPSDKRTMRAAFVRWDEDRIPEIIVTAQGDDKGRWRVYRTDGVLMAAGQLAEDIEKPIQGGALISTQDLNASGRDNILFTEAQGNRVWLIATDQTKTEPIIFEDQSQHKGVLAVGLQRPIQSFVILKRGESESNLYLLNRWNLDEGTIIDTKRPENLRMQAALTADNRQLLRFVQSGEPSYLREQGGILRIVSPEDAETINVWRYLQSPLGISLTDHEGRLFYDTWPR